MKALRVLICRTGAMGDVLHALPAVAALRAARPEWTIDWIVDPRWSPLLVKGDGRGPVVNHVHLAETVLWSHAPLSRATLRSVLALRRALRAEDYDLAVDMQGTLRSAVIGRMAGATELAGYADPREALAGRLYTQRIARHGTHVVEQGAALVSEATGIALTAATVELPREPWAQAWAAKTVAGRRVCLLSAGAGWGAKRWPVERFVQLAAELRALGFAVLVNQSRPEDARSSAIVAASGGAAEAVLCNVTALLELVRQSALVVGGDSGPVHLAAALGVPVVALFGPTDPARNGPWGLDKVRVLRDPSSVTSYKRSAKTEAGLAKISADQVVEAVRSLGPAGL